MFNTWTGPSLTHEEMDSMLKVVESHHVMRYAELNGLQLAIYDDSELANMYGPGALEELNKNCSRFQWAYVGADFLDKSHIYLEAYFDGNSWSGLEE